MMTKRWDAVAVLALLLAMAFSMAVGFDSRCETVRENTLRLHILADSDEPSAQARKLLVRDAILQATAADFAAAADLSGAKAAAGALLPRIRQVAQQRLQQAGSTEAVSVQLVHMYFDTRTYGSRTLPAGFYDAVRVIIGRGEGHNWWCVMFPPLCIGTAADSAELAAIEALNAPTEYKLSFAAVEWLERLLRVFRSHNP